MTTTEQRKVSLGFDHDEICEGQHICLLFRDDQERQRVMSRFLQSGIDAGEKLLYLVDTMTPDHFIAAMEDFGVDLSKCGESLDLLQAKPVYCPEETPFNSARMISTLTDFISQSQKDEYIGVRGTGEMSWALVEGRTEKVELFRYEAKINLMLQDHPMTVCCQYDTSKFDANDIMDVLEVHPLMIVNEKLIRNPMYVDPETFLAADKYN